MARRALVPRFRLALRLMLRWRNAPILKNAIGDDLAALANRYCVFVALLIDAAAGIRFVVIDAGHRKRRIRWLGEVIIARSRVIKTRKPRS